MTIEIKAPSFPESIADGTVAAWHKQPGEVVSRDEPLADIETDKVVLEIVAPKDGTLKEILKSEGDTVLSEEVIAVFVEGASERDGEHEPASGSAEPRAEPRAERKPPAEADQEAPAAVSPAARKLAEEHDVSLAGLDGSGRGGRITKEDVLRAVEEKDAAAKRPTTPPESEAEPRPVPAPGERVERRVPMTRLRASIARRLVDAQRSAAMLTTFNEVNMEPVMTLRSRYKELFQQRHNGTRLGFMSFFVRSSVEALKRFPAVNASIDGNEIVYHGFYDIGVAVGTERGLVVPVVRDADSLGLHQIEDTINDFGRRAREGKLGIDDMTGGTFTISNGGVFGSLLSTSILNPPQTAILGMHKIEERAVVEHGEVVVRPMMYLALSYDHRLIDGQEAVRFLVTIKELLEDPARILLEI